MRTPFFLSVLLTGFLLVQCGHSVSSEEVIFDRKVSLKKRIRLALQQDYLLDLGVDEATAKKVALFYRQRNYKPVWANKEGLTSTGKRMFHILQRPRVIGLPDKRWQNLKTKGKAVIIRELLLTVRLGLAVHDLRHGWFDVEVKSLRPLTCIPAFELKRIIAQTGKVHDWGLWFALQGAHHDEYRQLARSIFNHSFGKRISSTSFVVPGLKKDTIARVEQTKLSLVDKGYLTNAQQPDPVFTQALMHFQADNGLKPDAVIGTFTRRALEESAERKLDRAILSLERWRWRKPFPERYVWINIPEYLLRVIYDGKLISEHRVVVGKYETQTPQLESKISRIISFPYWTIPHSISSKETLLELKKNAAHASENHYRIYQKDVEIDPFLVNWSAYTEKGFPFKVRQDPGDYNSLGIIKFEFVNPYGVYLHDTPSKRLFEKDVRAFSHGCVRCNLPDSLARLILRRDKQRYTPDSLTAMLSRQEHHSIQLRGRVDIQIDYITVSVGADGRLITHPDIYFRDKMLLSYIEGFL